MIAKIAKITSLLRDINNYIHIILLKQWEQKHGFTDVTGFISQPTYHVSGPRPPGIFLIRRGSWDRYLGRLVEPWRSQNVT